MVRIGPWRGSPGALGVAGEEGARAGDRSVDETSAGRHIVCAYDAADRLLGYAFLFPKAPAGGRRELYLDLHVRPGLANDREVRDRLFDAILERANRMAEAEPQWAVRLQAVCPADGAEAIAYLEGRGLARCANGYVMARSLAEPLPEVPAPEGVEVRPWRMESEEEQRHYLEAHNAAFPDGPWDWAMLQYLLRSPMWAVGTTLTAFAGDSIVGSLLAYWNEAENRRTGERVGSTEEVFVVPGWRRRGIARCLIAHGLRYLRDHGLAEARLELSADNAAALALYHSMGYQVVCKQVLLAKEIARGGRG